MHKFALAVCQAAFALLTPVGANACSVIVLHEPSPAESREYAARLLESAAAVIDGEVVRPLTNLEPALVRAERILRGPHQQFFSVGERNSCDVALTTPGERLRLILVGGPDTYFLPVDYSNAVYEDELLGSDRRSDWPYFEGSGE